MKSLQSKSRGTKMLTVKSFLNSLSFRSISFLIICLGLGLLLSCTGDVNSPTVKVSGDGLIKFDTLDWLSPEDAGWSSADLQEAHQFAIQSECQAVMALYDGKVFFSRGNTHKNYEVHSIRETFLSALYGSHLARAKINQ